MDADADINPIIQEQLEAQDSNEKLKAEENITELTLKNSVISVRRKRRNYQHLLIQSRIS